MKTEDARASRPPTIRSPCDSIRLAHRCRNVSTRRTAQCMVPGFSPFHSLKVRLKFTSFVAASLDLCRCLRNKFNIFRARTPFRPYILLISARCVCLYLLSDYGVSHSSLGCATNPSQSSQRPPHMSVYSAYAVPYRAR